METHWFLNIFLTMKINASYNVFNGLLATILCYILQLISIKTVINIQSQKVSSN